MIAMNVYEDFREWFDRTFVYKKETKYPVTFNDIIESYPRKDECSEQVLSTIIEETNKCDAVFMRNPCKLVTFGVYYANIKCLK